MNRIARLSIVVILSLLIVYVGYDYFKDDSRGIPDISISTTNGVDISLQQLADNEHLIIVLVRSDCDYCKQELEALSNLASEFKETQLLFLSKEDRSTLLRLKQSFFSEEFEYVTFASASENDLERLADNDLAFPYNIWFDKSGRFRTGQKGIVPANRILEVTLNE
jgi:glutaredoxin